MEEKTREGRKWSFFLTNKTPSMRDISRCKKIKLLMRGDNHGLFLVSNYKFSFCVSIHFLQK